MDIPLGVLLKYYKREDIQSAVLSSADDKEVAVSFGLKGFGKRPDTLKYPRDVLEFVKSGASSFHCSEELWFNPLQLNPGLKKEELDSLRKGWNLVLDIDCPVLDYSKFAADLLIKALKYNGVNSVSVKFSGNHGFHIGVPFEAFPDRVHDIPVKDWFPDGPRKIALYLQEMIRPFLIKKLLKKENIKIIADRLKKPREELMKDGVFDPFAVLNIDTVLISSRHLYRMQYCFNEKSGLISIPIQPSEILGFDKESAKPEKVKVTSKFLDKSNVVPGEAKKLFIQAFDFRVKTEEVKVFSSKEFEAPQAAIPVESFPPCIKAILNGVPDGRKRAVFVLTNFLTSCGWGHDKVEELLKEWNKKNKEALREVYFLGQLRYHKVHNKKVLPPNCANVSYYQDLHICSPDPLCKKIKNPVNYAIIKQRSSFREKNPKAE